MPSLRATVTWLPLCALLASSGCCVNPFRHTRDPDPHGRPGDPESEVHRSIAPEQPAVQPASDADRQAGAGFDLRLVRVQPDVHIDTVQLCDVIYSGRPEAVEGRASQTYGPEAVQRMAIKCYAPTGESWADLIFTRQSVRRMGEVIRGRRVRLRILSADGGYFDYPIVQFVSVEPDDPNLSRIPARPQNAPVPNGFDLGDLRDDPALVGSTQQCAVSYAEGIDLVTPNDRRRRNYPAGVQNRLTVRCKHAGGEEPADLVFMPAQAIAALSVQRSVVVPVRVISRNGGFSDYPILQFAGE